jgi:hypothetical protein
MATSCLFLDCLPLSVPRFLFEWTPGSIVGSTRHAYGWASGAERWWWRARCTCRIVGELVRKLPKNQVGRRTQGGSHTLIVLAPCCCIPSPKAQHGAYTRVDSTSVIRFSSQLYPHTWTRQCDSTLNPQLRFMFSRIVIGRRHFRSSMVKRRSVELRM